MKKNYIFLVISVLCTVVFGGCNSKTSDEPKGANGETGAQVSQASEFSSFFTQTFSGKNGDAVVSTLDALINPETGIFLIYKPGALPVVKSCKTATQLKELMPPLLDNFANIKQPVQEGELPMYDCETFDKKGAFFKTVTGTDALIKTYENMKEMLYTDIPAADLDVAKKADGLVTHIFMSTEAGLQLSFAKVGDRWFLIAIDIAQFDCGA